MNFLTKIKNLFNKTEVTEESFEYESINHFLDGQEEGEEKKPKDDVELKCEQVVDATYQVEELQIEYDMVTSYFADIETIEKLPAPVRNKISEVAKRIATLETASSSFLEAEDRISDEDFRRIQGMEGELTDVFARLKELEDMDHKIKRDMKHLEAERNSQEYLQESIDQRQNRLRTVIMVFGSLSVATVLLLAIIGVAADVNLIFPILLILLLVAGMAALTMVVYRRLSYEFKLSEAKENKAIALLNRVKIKYVNNTSTLEYLYSKYNVKSLRELEYLHDQYQIMMDEIRKYQRTTGELRELSDELTELLFACGVKDPDIWMKQSLALIDSREMVEVKHSLNVRRQKLREQIAYNEDLRVNGMKAIQKMMEDDPEVCDRVRKELELYNIHTSKN